MLKLTNPFPGKIAQPFGANAVAMYSGMGLKGHPGIDFGVDWGTPIPCVANRSFCYSLLSKDNPNLMAYRAVCTLVEDGDKVYEITYGHCSDMFAKPGKPYDTGEIVGNIGNTGDVYSGGVLVSEALKASGSHAGSHLHLQVRLCKKVLATGQLDPLKHRLNDGSGLYVKDGYVYEVVDYENGYNGCIDPEQFFVDDSLSETIRAEVSVLNQTTDPAVRKSFIALIISQIKKFLGYE